MPWQILMLFQNLLAASFALLSRKINKQIKDAHFQVVAVIFTVILFCGIVYGLLNDGFQPKYVTENLGWFIFAGICFALTNIAGYQVFKYVDAGIASILSTLNVLAAVIIATLAIGEGLNWQQALGAVVLMFGIWLVMAINIKRSQKNRWFIGLILSVVAAVFFGLSATLEKHLLNSMPLSVYIMFGWGFQWLSVMGFSLIKRANWKKLVHHPVLKTVVLAGFVRAFAGLLFIYSLIQSDNVSIVSVLSGVKAIFVVILADIFLKERGYLKRKIEGAVLVALGVAIMLWK